MTTELYFLHPKKTAEPLLVSVFSTFEVAKEEFDNNISEGLAELNRGLYITKVTGLSQDNLEKVYETRKEIVKNDFEGFESERLESYEASAEDWSAESLSIDFDEDDVEETL